MKNRQYLLQIILIFLLGHPSLTYATSKHPGGFPETASPSPELESYVNNLVFTGTVKQIPGAVVLVTSENTYLLTGGDFSGIVDREVNVIGKVITEGSIEKIVVSRIQLASN